MIKVMRDILHYFYTYREGGVSCNMLIMMPNRMRNIPVEKIFPFDKKDIMIAMSENVVFALRDIRDDAGSVFIIKNIIESKSAVFGAQGFDERAKDFSEILFSRIERFFVTKRSDYIFFDKEEQEYLKKVIFSESALTARVEIYFIENNSFVKQDFEKMGLLEYSKIRVELSELGALAATSPKDYASMHEKSRNYDKITADRMAAFKIDKKLDKVFAKYHGLKDCRTQIEFNRIYRDLSKKLHPDINDGTESEFKDFQEDFAHVKKSRWFKGLV